MAHRAACASCPSIESVAARIGEDFPDHRLLRALPQNYGCKKLLATLWSVA